MSAPGKEPPLTPATVAFSCVPLKGVPYVMLAGSTHVMVWVALAIVKFLLSVEVR